MSVDYLTGALPPLHLCLNARVSMNLSERKTSVELARSSLNPNEPKLVGECVKRVSLKFT